MDSLFVGLVAIPRTAMVLGQSGGKRFEGHGECFVEIGGGQAAFGTGNFYAEPVPAVTLRSPSRWLHLGKVLFEAVWLHVKL